MKKKLLPVLAVVLSIAFLTGCTPTEPADSDDGNSGNPATYDVADVLNIIDSNVPVNTGKDIDENTLSLLMNMNMDNIEAFAGKVTQLNSNTDQIIVIQAKPGKAGDVKAELETWKQSMVEMSEGYAEFAGEKIKAENGRIFTTGDYVVLAILGDADNMLTEGPDATYDAVDNAIANAFK